MSTTEWREVELGDVIDLHDSKRKPLSGKERSTRQGIYPYYGASGVIDHLDDYMLDGNYLLVSEDGENLNSRKLPIAFWARGKFWVNNHAHIILGKEGKANTDFIRLWLLQANISGYITGAAQPKLSQGNLCRIKLNIPNIETQNKIASVLSNYDNLIENNSRRIAILEDMAQSLYHEWFVKSRFPDHEDVKFKDSPLGQIPDEWGIKTATDVIEFAPKTSLPKDGEKPFVAMPSISTSSMIIGDIEMRTGNSGTKFKNGDTLMARITPCLQNGKIGFVQFLDKENPIGFGSTEFIVMRSKELTPEFVYCLARSDSFKGNAINSMAGADGRQRVKNDCFNSYYLAVPPKDILDQFSALAEPAFKEIFILGQKNKNLRKQRDMLLPKLMSGSIKLTE
jgi:type I restriction enzyme S subunit